MKILIIEDDTGLNRGISFALEQDGYQTLCARTLQEGYTLFEAEAPNAVILDLNLPDGDGIDFCKKIRKLPGEKSKTPLLMLTARDMEVDEIMGLSSGADDYMTKPFSISVLKIRLQNMIRRKYPENETEHIIKSGKISIDTRTFRAFCEDEEIILSITEFRLLQYFLEHKNQALLKEQILQHVWDVDSNFVEENTLSVNISRLRKKLGGNYIRTIQGIGYLWEENS